MDITKTPAYTAGWNDFMLGATNAAADYVSDDGNAYRQGWDDAHAVYYNGDIDTAAT